MAGGTGGVGREVRITTVRRPHGVSQTVRVPRDMQDKVSVAVEVGEWTTDDVVSIARTRRFAWGVLASGLGVGLWLGALGALWFVRVYG